jgi:hypothetical protein
MKPAQIKPIIDEFTGQDSGLQKALKKFRNDAEWKKKTGRQPYRLKNLVNGAEKAELMDDGRINFHWKGNEYWIDDYMLISPKTRNKEYIITDVTSIKYIFAVGLEGAKPGFVKDKCNLIMQFCNDIALDIKNILIEIDGRALKEFSNSKVDFKALLPGMNVKVDVTSENINIWSWDLKTKQHISIPDKFDVTITDSYGTKTYHFKKVYKCL